MMVNQVTTWRRIFWEHLFMKNEKTQTKFQNNQNFTTAKYNYKHKTTNVGKIALDWQAAQFKSVDVV